MKIYILLFWIFLSAVRLPAAPAAEPEANVVASTAWTAAFALAAGAGTVHILSPYEMQHPSEYELKPSDLAILSRADLVIFAGYETMAGKLMATLGEDSPKLLQIPTDYSIATVESSLKKIAAELGTEVSGVITDYKNYLVDWRSELSEKGLAGAKVITHFFQKPLALELGFEVIGVFGPGPLQAKQIVELSELPADIIFDNWHNKISQPLLEVMKNTPVVELINFPGAEGTRTLLDVLELNRARLDRAVFSTATMPPAQTKAIPPSTSRVWPVIFLASSDARKRTALPISSSVCSLPSGTRGMRAFSKYSRGVIPLYSGLISMIFCAAFSHNGV